MNNLYNENKTLEEKLLDNWIINDIIRDEEGSITNIYLQDNWYGLVACLTYPHQGNNNKFILRIEAIDVFDRWSNVSCEVFFNNEEDIPTDPSEVWELFNIDDFAYDDDDWEED